MTPNYQQSKSPHWADNEGYVSTIQGVIFMWAVDSELIYWPVA